MAGFESELVSLINRESLENVSNTPDWILAEFLVKCLHALNDAVEQRERWYGRDPRMGPAGQITPEES